MHRAVVEACVPWAAMLGVALLAAWLTLRLSRAEPDWGRLARLHRDEGGGVQALSFVLALPFFVMIVLFIVQVSQLMIGTIVVHYAAFAAARSAVVWIPAEGMAPEGANCIASYRVDPEVPPEEQSPPVLDPESPNYGRATGGMWYIVEPVSSKYSTITGAAVLACMPISPSRDLGIPVPPAASTAAEVLKAVYRATTPGALPNARTAERIDNKLAYALENTKVEIRFYHKNAEPPLVTYFQYPDIAEFRFNELGWQDQLTVTVKHDFALLPGPGRFLARFVAGPSGTDRVAPRIHRNGAVYVVPLKASATMVIEGEKPIVQYEYNPY